MQCTQAKRLFSEYIDDALTPDMKRRVEEHLAACSRCSAELSGLKAAREAVRSMKTISAPPDFLKKVHERLEKPSPFRKIMDSLLYPLRIKLPLEAAGVALAVILVLFVYRGAEKEFQKTLPSGVAKAPATTPAALAPTPAPPPALLSEQKEKAAAPRNDLMKSREESAQPRAQGEQANLSRTGATDAARPEKPIELVLVLNPRTALAKARPAPSVPPSQPPPAATGVPGSASSVGAVPPPATQSAPSASPLQAPALQSTEDEAQVSKKMEETGRGAPSGVRAFKPASPGKKPLPAESAPATEAEAGRPAAGGALGGATAGLRHGPAPATGAKPAAESAKGLVGRPAPRRGPEGALGGIRRAAESVGGSIVSVKRSADGAPEEVALRIPSANYGTFMNGLRRLGEIQRPRTDSLPSDARPSIDVSIRIQPSE